MNSLIAPKEKLILGRSRAVLSRALLKTVHSKIWSYLHIKGRKLNSSETSDPIKHDWHHLYMIYLINSHIKYIYKTFC